ncbi:CRISPR-associated RAMP protein, Cmr4 family [Ferroglobus placidus DSM 10642]|uniref:CRISPR-associated RAMP protein, Cmr4 family n=1 Tax=Ferroglobus placidus (strain DSM 10642 / AEDII12DO) TaxID=589924 RepID=D3RZT0_FERPA|nr:type III-B CRISPR module RAMP protein Cmr4 [Ferroglobus placidus]ADC65993.1 CRISPR-associated RAMP protein, Cmr4 family [Ferroglobus placidus DSM 10642]
MLDSNNKGGNEICRVRKYFALAIDPIHVGTGGYRIGRVDNTIVREPATGIPKIPGTTIEGCCRSYAYLKIMENDKLRGKLRKRGFNYQCSKGKVSKEKGLEPCGVCPICITFGYARDSERDVEIEKDGQKVKKKIAKSMQAMALFSDARILFFPVATMIGPVWVTCPMVLREAGIKENSNDIPEPEDNKFVVPKVSDSEKTTINPPENMLNFGWLLLNQDTNKSTNVDNWVYRVDYTKETKKLSDVEILKDVLTRIVIVSDNLFATIVNSNLEVRTSVAIDPEKGAVEEGALFTYEAIPRGTVFWFDVVYQNPKNFPSLNGIETKSWDGNDKEPDFELIENTVNEVLKLFEYLGVGGMGSRGFGRLKVLGGKNGRE